MLRYSRSVSCALLATFVFFLTSGCATVFKKNTQSIDVYSTPSGADVYLNGQLVDTTPATIFVNGTVHQTLELRMDGYQSQVVVLTSSVGVGWVVIDVIFGAFPVVIDAVTGNWNSIDKKTVKTTLEKK